MGIVEICLLSILNRQIFDKLSSKETKFSVIWACVLYQFKVVSVLRSFFERWKVAKSLEIIKINMTQQPD